MQSWDSALPAQTSGPPLDDISICTLTSKDVVRHPLVQKIVKAYEDYEKKSARPRENRRKK